MENGKLPKINKNTAGFLLSWYFAIVRTCKMLRNKIYFPIKIILHIINPRLKYINYVCTYRCNGQCLSCNIWQKKEDRELSAEELDAALNLNFEEMSISGGEPFLRQDITEVIKICLKKTKRVVSVSTNGNFPIRVADSIREVGYEKKIHIGVSLDGQKQIHELIKKGTLYEKAIETILMCRKMNMPTCISFTVTPLNYNEILKVYNLSKKYGCNFTARIYVSDSLYYGNIHIGGIIPDLKKELDEISGDKVDEVEKFFIANLSAPCKIRCLAGFITAFIMPDGRVYACPHGFYMGDLKKQKIKNIWFSWRAFIARIKILRCGKKCWNECVTMPSLREFWFFF
ncbi:MAG: radical SAM protein [Candidatus Omnitrophica bacterium]|nr:radical SAM protein [Candidatus Omnitrophota bacterium]